MRMLEEPLKKPIPQMRIWKSEELFGEDREILIQHRQDYYRLRMTQSGKLVLNK